MKTDEQVAEEAVSQVPGRSIGYWATPVWALGLGLLTFSLGHGFYRDDFTWLERACLAQGDPVAILRPWLPGFFRPVGQLAFYLQYQLFQFEPLPYNVTGLLLHGLVGVGVWKLSSRIGLELPARSFATLLFLVGTGHFCKPIVWVCSHPILLGTGLALSATLLVHPRHGVQPSKKSLVFACGFAFAAMMTHDLLLLVPPIIAVSSWQGGLKSKTGSSVLLLGGISFFVLSTSMRGQIGLDHAAGPHIVINGAQFLASLLAPVSSMPQLVSLADRIGVSGPVAGVFSLLILAAGVGALIGMLVFVVKGGKEERSLLFVGLSLLFLPLLVRAHPWWIDSRYAYPASALLTPHLVGGFLALTRRFRSRRTIRIIATVIGVGWFLLLAAGNLSMQAQALEEGENPRVATRWARIDSVRAGQIQ